jgi:hypothetical protein
VRVVSRIVLLRVGPDQLHISQEGLTTKSDDSSVSVPTNPGSQPMAETYRKCGILGGIDLLQHLLQTERTLDDFIVVGSVGRILMIKPQV